MKSTDTMTWSTSSTGSEATNVKMSRQIILNSNDPSLFFSLTLDYSNQVGYSRFVYLQRYVKSFPIQDKTTSS